MLNKIVALRRCPTAVAVSHAIVDGVHAVSECRDVALDVNDTVGVFRYDAVSNIVVEPVLVLGQRGWCTLGLFQWIMLNKVVALWSRPASLVVNSPVVDGVYAVGQCRHVNLDINIAAGGCCYA